MTDGLTAMYEDDDEGVIPKTKEEVMAAKPEPLSVQVGGSHYKDYAIQPVEYCIANNMSFCEGNVVKYVTRWKDKGGVQDLKKARHFLDILIAQQEAI